MLDVAVSTTRPQVATTPVRKPIRILLADEHPVFRFGMSATVASELDMRVIGEAASGQEAVKMYAALQPDLLLIGLDVGALDGLQAVAEIRRSYLSARILVLTTYQGDVIAQRALEAGAQGYVLKGIARQDLVEVIRAVHAGHRRISSVISERLVTHMGQERLSAREVAVLQLLTHGNSNQRIASALKIAETTAKSHIQSILSKLSARDRTHAVTVGLARGIIQL